MRIAILSCSFERDFSWFLSELNRDRIEFTIEKTRKSINTPKGEYIIVTRPEDVYGIEFAHYIKGPSYVTLEDLVRQRIR